MVKWALSTLLFVEFIIIISASIAGVTYRDNFDFEDRYRNDNECNPLYWHPLHMPEYCAEIYEKLIRSKIESALYPRKSYEIISSEEEYYDEYYREDISSTAYRKMLDLLNKDIKKDPSSPTLGIHANLGPVAIYNQEVSKKSANMIKKLATAYAKYGQEIYADYLGYNDLSNPELYSWDSRKNDTSANNKRDGSLFKKDKNEDRVTRTKTKNGGVVTIVETLQPRRRRRHAINWLRL